MARQSFDFSFKRPFLEDHKPCLAMLLDSEGITCMGSPRYSCIEHKEL